MNNKAMTTVSKHLFQGMYFATDFVVKSAAGSYFTTTEGRRILDFTSGFAVTNLGHNHPAVVRAVQEQAGNIIHCQSSMVHSLPMLALTERLVGDGDGDGVEQGGKGALLAPHFDRVNYWNSGAEAVEGAMKLAKHATKRHSFVGVHGGYHGRTFGTMGLTTSKNTVKMGLAPYLPGMHIAPNPYFAGEAAAIDGLDTMFKTIVPADDVAAIIVEPVQGENGYVPIPVGYLQHLRRTCDKHGILLIFDEVQCGMGRAATNSSDMMVFQQHRVVPDILVMAKGIANGMPLSLVASRTDLTKSQHPGAMGGTYSANALACAAAVAVLDTFKAEKVLSNALLRSCQLRSFLSSLDRTRFNIVDVRGLGMMQGIEFRGAGVAQRITTECLSRNLFLSTAGAKETIRFMPPLTVSEQEMAAACETFEDSLRALFPAPLRAKMVRRSNIETTTTTTATTTTMAAAAMTATATAATGGASGKVIAKFE